MVEIDTYFNIYLSGKACTPELNRTIQCLYCVMKHVSKGLHYYAFEV